MIIASWAGRQRKRKSHCGEQRLILVRERASEEVHLREWEKGGGKLTHIKSAMHSLEQAGSCHIMVISY